MLAHAANHRFISTHAHSTMDAFPPPKYTKKLHTQNLSSLVPVVSMSAGTGLGGGSAVPKYDKN